MPGRRPVVWFVLAALLAVGAIVLMSRTGSASSGSTQVVVARTRMLRSSNRIDRSGRWQMPRE